MKYEEILERLVQARKAAGLSQGQVGKMVDMSTAWLSDIERGQNNLSVQHLLKLVEVYDASIEWVMTGVNPYFDRLEVMAAADRLGDDALIILKALYMMNSNGTENK